MERLRGRDLRTVLEFLHGSYSALDLTELKTRIVSGMPAVVPNDLSSFDVIDPVTRKIVEVSVPPVPFERHVFERHIAKHPLIAHHRRTGDGSAVKISDFLTRRQYHRLGLYAECFRQAEVEHQMAAAVTGSPRLVIGIALCRSRGDFSERDRAVMNLIRPHIILAYRNAEAFSLARQELQQTAHAYETLRYGVIELERDGHVRTATPRAEALLTKYFGTATQSPHVLPDELNQWVRQGLVIHGRTNDLYLPRPPFVHEQEFTDLIVRLLPGSDSGRLVVEERLKNVPAATLKRLGLTRREADVMTCVLRRQTNSDIAASLGTSERTVAKHLEHIYEKLGVHTRTAAAAWVSEAAMLARHAPPADSYQT